MLSGIKFIDQREVEKAYKQEKKEKREKEKKRKKNKKSSEKRRKHDSKRDQAVSASDNSGGSASGSESDGDRADAGHNVNGPGGARVPQAGDRDSWMTDSSLFSQRLADAKHEKEEIDEREKREAEEDKNKPSVSAALTNLPLLTPPPHHHHHHHPRIFPYIHKTVTPHMVNDVLRHSLFVRDIFLFLTTQPLSLLAPINDNACGYSSSNNTFS
jgi:hypothetical protein